MLADLLLVCLCVLVGLLVWEVILLGKLERILKEKIKRDE